MRIGIVLYEDDSWILAKFSRNLQKHLATMGITNEILKQPTDGFDINHHIDFSYCTNRNIEQVNAIHTSMITHTDDIRLFQHAKAHLNIIDRGICMSRDQVTKLIDYGVARDKLTYINPAHDQLTSIRPSIIGIASRVYMDGRKNQNILPKALENHDTALLHIKIMGSGWETVVKKIRSLGFTVDYIPDFDRDAYIAMISSLDYYMYLGEDEGSMGYLDALHAGVGTIVTPQGFHLDVPCEIDFPIEPTAKSLSDALAQINGDRLRRRESVKSWTWRNYAEQHVLVWKDLLYNDRKGDVLSTQPEKMREINRFKLTGRYFLRGLRRMKHRVIHRGTGSLFAKIIEKIVHMIR